MFRRDDNVYADDNHADNDSEGDNDEDDDDKIESVQYTMRN